MKICAEYGWWAVFRVDCSAYSWFLHIRFDSESIWVRETSNERELKRARSPVTLESELPHTVNRQTPKPTLFIFDQDSFGILSSN